VHLAGAIDRVHWKRKRFSVLFAHSFISIQP